MDPDDADGATLGSGSKEWSDLYLASSGVIYGENDQSNTLTSSATGWTANLNLAATTYGSNGSVSDAELLYINSLSSNAQNQLDARCLESVFGTAIGTGLTLDATTLKTHAALQSIAGLTETNGGMLYGTADNTYAWLAAGATNEILVGGGAGAPVWTTATGTGAPVRAGSPALTGSPTVSTSIDPDSADGATLGSGSKEWSDGYFANGAVLYFQNDQSITLTSGATGLTCNEALLADNVPEYGVLYIDAGAMVPCTTNGAETGTNEYGTNDVEWDYYAFDGGATEERVQFKTVMPEEWDRSTVKIKFYWSSATGSTSGDTCEWGIKAGALANSDAIDSALGTAVTVSDALLANNGADLQITGATAAMTVAGTPGLGEIITFEVYRNTDGTDNMTEDAWLFGVLIQYKKDNTVSAW